MFLSPGTRVLVVRPGDKPEQLSGPGVVWEVTPFGSAAPTAAIVDLDAGPRVWVSLDLAHPL